MGYAFLLQKGNKMPGKGWFTKAKVKYKKKQATKYKIDKKVKRLEEKKHIEKQKRKLYSASVIGKSSKALGKARKKTKGGGVTLSQFFGGKRK